jgi:hypothetical protein
MEKDKNKKKRKGFNEGMVRSRLNDDWEYIV